jgi:DNA-binding response OmpR family regulator
MTWHLSVVDLKVLVVDDEPDFVDLIVHGLQANGIECLEATNAMQALEKARDLVPDAVILDIMLPDLDGFTVCEMLRRQPSTARIPVVMLTCLGGTVSRLNGLSAGADDYLTNPFKIPELISHLHSAIRHRAELMDGAA